MARTDVSYASRYRIFKTPANLFGAARDAKLMLADKSLSGTGDLEVTPQAQASDLSIPFAFTSVSTIFVDSGKHCYIAGTT